MSYILESIKVVNDESNFIKHSEKKKVKKPSDEAEKKMI